MEEGLGNELFRLPGQPAWYLQKDSVCPLPGPLPELTKSLSILRLTGALNLLGSNTGLAEVYFSSLLFAEHLEERAG